MQPQLIANLLRLGFDNDQSVGRGRIIHAIIDGIVVRCVFNIATSERGGERVKDLCDANEPIEADLLFEKYRSKY